MFDKLKERKLWLLESFRSEKANLLKLEKYEIKDGDAIETDADGKVHGEVKDGEYVLADGSGTLEVKDGVATKKEADKSPEADKQEVEKAADAPEGDTTTEGEGTQEPTLADVMSAIQSLTTAVGQLVEGLGLSKQEAETKLAAAEAKVAKLEEKPAVQKPGVGLGLSTVDEKPLTKAQQAVALAKMVQGK